MKENRDNSILSILQENPTGYSMSELFGKTSKHNSIRSLQREINKLIKAGDITKVGKARATRYHARKATPIENRDTFDTIPKYSSVLEEPRAEYNAKPQKNRDFSYSATAQEIVALVRAPQESRKAVGYRREFLDAYIPNQTQYLPTETRDYLRSIGRHDAMSKLPPGTHARQIVSRLIIDLSWNSSRLEGNTYSLLETDELLAAGHTDSIDRAMEATMLLNHKMAIEFLVEEPSELKFNRYTLFNLHSTLTEDLMKDSQAEGTLRRIPVGIGGSVYHPSSDPHLIEECFGIIMEKAEKITDPLECAFFLMMHIPYLQPFEDGNKRTSRIAANIPLIQQNFSPLSFVDVSTRHYADALLSIYELNSIEPMIDVFAWAYTQSAARYMTIKQEVGAPDPIRIAYRFEIKERIRDVVVQGMDKSTAAQHLKQWAAREITASDRAGFITAVEERLLTLNEGNIVRVKIRPSEFQSWWTVWSKTGGARGQRGHL